MPYEGDFRSCHPQTNYFDDLTSTTAHEMIEAVTDPEVGFQTAWYDLQYGEIGDICAWHVGLITGHDGHAYTVQQEWSNHTSACITTVPSDFSLGAVPATVSTAPGGSA